MEIKSIREFLSWVDQKVFFLDENEGSVCLKNGEKAEDSLIEPYTMKLLISDIKKHSYLWEKHENHAYTLKRQYQMDYVPEIPVPTAEMTSMEADSTLLPISKQQEAICFRECRGMTEWKWKR